MTTENTVIDDRELDDNEEFDNAFAEFANVDNHYVDDNDDDPKDDLPADDEPGDDNPDPEPQEEENEAEKLRKQLEELKKERDYYEHSFKSQVGRVSALQRKLDGEKRNAGQEGAKTDDETNVDDDELKALMEDYPEIAKPILNFIEKKYGKVEAEVDKRFEPIYQQEEQKYIAGQIELMNKDFPGWDETIKTPEYQEWLAQQPEAVQSMTNSIHAKDYAYLIRTFQATHSNGAKEKASSIAERRQQKLAANVSIPSKGQSRKSVPPDDFEAAFNFYAGK